MTDSSATESPEISQPCIDEIDQRLREYETLVDRIPIVSPDFIASSFPYDSGVPNAAVCLRDCQTTIGQALYAFHQMCFQVATYRTADPPNPMLATWVERFFLEDAAMRLYSAAEHVANAIALLLAIPKAELAAFKSPSQWERVRKALNASRSNSPIAAAMDSFRRSKEWRFSIKYRGHVVHNQPPNLEGLGIQYERRPRWQPSADGSHMILRVRQGDKPAHTPAVVKECVLVAFAELISLVARVTDVLFETLAAHGIPWDGGQTLTLNPFASGE